jgi:hypothetical protein
LRAYRGEQHNTTECFNGLRDEAASLIDNLIVERDALRAELAALRDVLLRSGFRECDIPACNCGSWHHVGGFAERFREIDEATRDEYRNGEKLLDRIKRMAALVTALRANLPALFARGYAAGHHDTAEGCYIHVLPIDMPTYFADRQEVINAALSNS